MILSAALFAAMVQTQDAETLLSEIRKVYAGVTTAKFHVKFETADSHMNRLSGSCDVLFLRPYNVKVVLAGLTGGPKTVVSNGRTVTTLLKSARKSVAFTLEALSHALPLNVETFAFLDWKHELSTEKGGGMEGSVLSLKSLQWNDRTWTVIEELNRADDSLDRYYIGNDDHVVWRVVDMSANGKTVYSDTQVSGLALGEPIPESTFETSNRS